VSTPSWFEAKFSGAPLLAILDRAALQTSLYLEPSGIPCGAIVLFTGRVTRTLGDSQNPGEGQLFVGVSKISGVLTDRNACLRFEVTETIVCKILGFKSGSDEARTRNLCLAEAA
jgi:hypothetical protein